ncbi:MAG: hypothetical protein DRN20_05060 [Thermoplasmata archaeon]|nr:MAG: hypothetical protein DRN20_05060 [Thermoplasmata archaeon]
MMEYERTGILRPDEIPIPSEDRLRRGPVAIFECPQEIPCNPCVDSCPVGAVSMENINSPPIVDYDKCIGCAQCLRVCPGLAIFLIDLSKGDHAHITIPYEFLPLPKEGDMVDGLSRDGKPICKAKVVRVLLSDEGTNLVTIEVPKELFMDVRNIRVRK